MLLWGSPIRRPLQCIKAVIVVALPRGLQMTSEECRFESSALPHPGHLATSRLAFPLARRCSQLSTVYLSLPTGRPAWCLLALQGKRETCDDGTHGRCGRARTRVHEKSPAFVVDIGRCWPSRCDPFKVNCRITNAVLHGHWNRTRFCFFLIHQFWFCPRLQILITIIIRMW